MQPPVIDEEKTRVAEFYEIYSRVLESTQPKPSKEYECVHSSHFLVWAFNKFIPNRKPKIVGGGANDSNGIVSKIDGKVYPHLWVEFTKDNVLFYADIGAQKYGYEKILIGTASELSDILRKDEDEVTRKVLSRVYEFEPSFKRMI